MSRRCWTRQRLFRSILLRPGAWCNWRTKTSERLFSPFSPFFKCVALRTHAFSFIRLSVCFLLFACIPLRVSLGWCILFTLFWCYVCKLPPLSQQHNNVYYIRSLMRRVGLRARKARPKTVKKAGLLMLPSLPCKVCTFWAVVVVVLRVPPFCLCFRLLSYSFSSYPQVFSLFWYIIFFFVFKPYFSRRGLSFYLIAMQHFSFY